MRRYSWKQTIVVLFAMMMLPLVFSGAVRANTIFNGPVDSGEATFGGADEIGSYDGSVTVNNSNDFTVRAIPTGATQLINSSSTPGSPSGNTLSLAAAPTVNVPNELYYSNTSLGTDTITLTATAPAAPAGWKVEICADNGSGTAPNCSTTGPDNGCTISLSSGWVSGTIGNSNASGAGSTFTAKYCVATAISVILPQVIDITYWTVYTAPQNGLVAYTRYDGSVNAVDNEGTPISNATHNEMYPGWVPLTKTFSVLSSGCPSGVSPSYPALGVCPGGILLYTIDYRNIVLGPGSTSNEPAAAMQPTAAGSLVITDDGTLATTSQNTTPNWASFSNGVLYQLHNNLGTTTNALCGPSHTSDCGDSTNGTTFLYYTGIPAGSTGSATFASGTDTKFAATIGGSSFQLWPAGFAALSQGAGDISQGTMTLAVQVQ